MRTSSAIDRIYKIQSKAHYVYFKDINLVFSFSDPKKKNGTLVVKEKSFINEP